jgi:hypothetical protein
MTSPDENRIGKHKSWVNSDLVPVAIIILWAVIQMYPFTIEGKALMPDTWKSIHPWARGVDIEHNQTNIFDTVLEYNPWYEYSQDALKDGRVPHWNPYQFCGAPLYANRLVPFFYPPFMLAELISDPHRIVGTFQFFNLILSGLGMYLLLKRWKIGRWVSVASAVLWMTCGAHFLPFPPQMLGTIGFPWLLWAIEGFFQKPSMKYIAIAGLVVGLILMTGYPITIVHFSYFIVIYTFIRWLIRKSVNSPDMHWTIPLVALLAAYLIGLGVSAISTAPTMAYSKETIRSVGLFSDHAADPDIRLLITSPAEIGHDPILERFGDRTDILLPINGRGSAHAWKYGGIIVYFLGFLGILALKPRTLPLAIPGLIYAILIWFPQIQMALLNYLPGWRVSIIPPIQVLNLIMYLLAAIGLDAFLAKKSRISVPSKILLIILNAACIWFTWRFLKIAPVMNIPDLTVSHDPNLLAHSPFHMFYLVAFISLSVLISMLTFLPEKLNPVKWIPVVAIVIFSLATFWYLQPVYSDINCTPETTFTEWVRGNMASDIATADQGNRIARWALLDMPFNPDKRQKSPFLPNLNIPYGLKDVGGYDSLVPQRYIEYCTLFENAFMSYRALMAFEGPSTMYHQRFRNLGVRWIITLGMLPRESRRGCTLRWDDRTDSGIAGSDDPKDFMQVWEINYPEPRAFLTRNIAYANDPDDSALVQAANWTKQGYNVVVVEKPDEVNRSPAFEDTLLRLSRVDFYMGDVEFTRDDPEFISMNVAAPADCYLVLRDGWYPEWSASVDGVKTDIYPADYAFRAVFIPAGEHTVEFRFVPRSFYQGKVITICSLLLIALMIFIRKKSIVLE